MVWAVPLVSHHSPSLHLWSVHAAATQQQQEQDREIHYSILFSDAANEVRIAPVGKTVLLGTSTLKFHCTTYGSIPQWVINGSELDRSQHGVHRERGIIRCAFRQISGRLYNSTLCVEAEAVNNNTEVQCAVADSNIQSQAVAILLQGNRGVDSVRLLASKSQLKSGCGANTKF